MLVFPSPSEKHSTASKPNMFLMRRCLVVAVLCMASVALATLSGCVDDGVCTICETHDLSKSYCKQTGKSIKVKCLGANGMMVDDNHSCLLTPEEEQIRVIFFQVMMAIIGGLAFWGVQVRKKEHSNLFDVRKTMQRNKK